MKERVTFLPFRRSQNGEEKRGEEVNAESQRGKEGTRERIESSSSTSLLLCVSAPLRLCVDFPSPPPPGPF